MKKLYLLTALILVSVFAFAQQYTSKYNAKHGITKDFSVVQPQMQQKDVQVVYFSEDFEGGDLATAGWTSIDNDNDGYEWGFWCTATTAHGGTCALVSQSWDGSPLTPDNYAITPAIDLTSATGTVFFGMVCYCAGSNMAFRIL